MLLMMLISLLLNIAGMGLQVVFYASLAYFVTKMGRKGWKAGE